MPWIRPALRVFASTESLIAPIEQADAKFLAAYAIVILLAIVGFLMVKPDEFHLLLKRRNGKLDVSYRKSRGKTKRKR